MKFKVNGITYRWSMHRFMINLAVVALIAIGCILYSTSLTKANSGHKSTTIIVHKGDTLWSIAESLAPQNDPREIIANIKKDNNLQQVALATGQRLKISLY